MPWTVWGWFAIPIQSSSCEESSSEARRTSMPRDVSQAPLDPRAGSRRAEEGEPGSHRDQRRQARRNAVLGRGAVEGVAWAQMRFERIWKCLCGAGSPTFSQKTLTGLPIFLSWNPGVLDVWNARSSNAPPGCLQQVVKPVKRSLMKKHPLLRELMGDLDSTPGSGSWEGSVDLMSRFCQRISKEHLISAYFGSRFKVVTSLCRKSAFNDPLLETTQVGHPASSVA